MWPRQLRGLGRAGLDPLLHVVEQGLHLLQPAAQGQCVGPIDVDPGAAAHDLLGQLLDPAQQDRRLAAREHAGDVLFDHRRCPLEILGSHGMDHGLFQGALALVPPAGAAVQLADLFGRSALSQRALQQVGEQVVIAIPPPFVVEGHHEQVGSLQMGQDGLAVAHGAIRRCPCRTGTIHRSARRFGGAPSHGVTQGPAHPLQDGGLDRESPGWPASAG